MASTTANSNAAGGGDLPTLTGLRFLAALWVVLYHFSDQISGQPVPFIRYGPRAVDFFFILSGFIMAHVYGPAIETGTFRASKFYRRRFARLYPLHIVTLGAVLLIYVITLGSGLQVSSQSKYDFSQLWRHLLLLHAWLPDSTPAWNIPSWSISAEMFAYILFPLAMTIGGGARAWLVGASTFFVAIAIALPGVTGVSLFELQFQLGIVRIVPAFLLGIALWKVWSEQQLKMSPWMVWPLLALIPLASSIPLLVCLLFALLILAAAESDRQGRRTWLNASLFVLLGEASFSLYMIHGPFQTMWFNGLALMGIDAPATAYALGVLLVIAASIVSLKLVERPAQALLIGRRQRREPVL